MYIIIHCTVGQIEIENPLEIMRRKGPYEMRYTDAEEEDGNVLFVSVGYPHGLK